MKRLLILILFICFFSSKAFSQISQQSDILFLNDSILWEEPYLNNHNPLFKYKPGDDLTWASPYHPDTNWTKFYSSDSYEVTWFRLHIEIDSNLTRTIIGINGYSTSPLKVFLDGILICDTLERFPVSIPQVTAGKHLLAIRYQLQQKVPKHQNNIYFFIQFSDFNKSIKGFQSQRSQQMIFVSLPLGFALMHLILFFFLPTARANLYYSIFLVLIAITTYSDIHATFLSDYASSHVYLLIHRFFIPLVDIALLLFIYEIFYDKLPKQFWAFCVAYIIVQILILYKPEENYHYYVELGILRSMEIIRIIIVAIHKKKDGAVIFALGIFVVFIFGTYDALLDLDLMTPFNEITNAYYFGLIGLFIATTVFLSRDFARSNQKIIDQENQAKRLELEKKLLQAEDKRKSKELEDARRLQLSMLPQCLNDFPGLDICFNLIPASEVGGDYYDFFSSKNSLTIVIGDATGHGMQAGMMVSIVKSLFVADIKYSSLVSFLNKTTKTIRKMKLGQIYMALQLLRIEKDKISITSAGMPPVYIYRQASDDIEEIKIKAMPLGGPVSAPFKEVKTVVNKGDVILMLSDGLPEIFNVHKEMPDYPLVISKFKESVNKSANDIVNELINFGNEWRQEYPQQDDITLVVIKIKN